jgi:chromosomal replication initiator protein
MVTLEQYTCEMFGCQVEQLFTPSRYREAVNAREVCMLIMRKYTSACFREIGTYFNRNHATVVSAIHTAQNLYDTDKSFKAKVNKIYDRCREGSLDIPFTPSYTVYVGCKVEEDNLIIL